MTPKTAIISIQGNPNSRKLHTPEGYVVLSGHMPKTFHGEGGLKAAVSWALKRGYLPKLAQPLKRVGPDRVLAERFRKAVEEAEAERVAAAKAKAEENEDFLPGHQVVVGERGRARS